MLKGMYFPWAEGEARRRLSGFSGMVLVGDHGHNYDDNEEQHNDNQHSCGQS